MNHIALSPKDGLVSEITPEKPVANEDTDPPVEASVSTTASKDEGTSSAEAPRPTSAEVTADRPRWITRRRTLLFGGGMLLCVTALTWGGLGKYIWGEEFVVKPTIVHVTPDDADRPETAEEREARWRNDVVGRWHTYWKGDRYMTIHADGTATIEANLTDYSWAEALVVGTRKVTFEITWTIENGALAYDTVGGTPKASVDVITGIHGKRKVYPIVHVTEDEFRYQSDENDPDYIWNRVPPDGDQFPKGKPATTN